MKKRGISKQKIAVVVAQDRNGSLIARKAGSGRVKAEEIDRGIYQAYCFTMYRYSN